MCLYVYVCVCVWSNRMLKAMLPNDSIIITINNFHHMLLNCSLIKSVSVLPDICFHMYIYLTHIKDCNRNASQSISKTLRASF